MPSRLLAIMIPGTGARSEGGPVLASSLRRSNSRPESRRCSGRFYGRLRRRRVPQQGEKVARKASAKQLVGSGTIAGGITLSSTDKEL